MKSNINKIMRSNLLSMLAIVFFIMIPIVYNVHFINSAEEGMYAWPLWMISMVIMLVKSPNWYSSWVIIFFFVGLKNQMLFMIFGEFTRASPLSSIVNISIFSLLSYFIIENHKLKQKIFCKEIDVKN